MSSKPKGCKTAKRPGIVIPFTFRRTLRLLRTDQKARLLDAVLAYGDEGIEPEFLGDDDVGFMIAFEQLREKIDFDGQSYAEKVIQNRRNAYIPAWNAYAAKNGIDQNDGVERNAWIDRQIEIADERERLRTLANGMQSLVNGGDGSQTKDKDKDKPTQTIQETNYTKDKGSDRERGMGEEEEELFAATTPAPALHRPPSALGGDYTAPSETEWNEKRQSAVALLASVKDGR